MRKLLSKLRAPAIPELQIMTATTHTVLFTIRRVNHLVIPVEALPADNFTAVQTKGYVFGAISRIATCTVVLMHLTDAMETGKHILCDGNAIARYKRLFDFYFRCGIFLFCRHYDYWINWHRCCTVNRKTLGFRPNQLHNFGPREL